jgi:hypothetical protein
METLTEPDTYRTLCLYLPELVHVTSPVVANLVSLLTTIRQFEFVLTELREIAICTKYLNPKVVEHIQRQLINHEMVKYYTLRCSDDLEQYHCFCGGSNEIEEKIHHDGNRMWMDGALHKAFFALI